MTINSTTRKTNPFTGNGSAHTFPFTFKVFSDADIVVKKLEASTSIETTLTLGLNNDYIVTLNADQNSNPGGSITLKSGGNNQNLASGFSLVITSDVDALQGVDLTNQGGFFPEVINDALDKAIIIHQQQQTELDRSIRFSLTNTIGSLEITENAAARANKVLGFDNLGEFNIVQELGTYRGNWTAGRAYVVRDLVKDTSTNNIFMCNVAHTSSGSQPLTTNTDSAKWDLIVDAATATTSSTNAASSATAAASSATAAASSQTAAASSATSAASSASTATTKATQADTAKTAAQTAQTAAETAKTAAETALDSFDDRYLGAKSSNPTLDNDGNALIDGALYFNTTVNRMRVYDLGNTTWLEVTITGSDLTNTNTVAGAITNVNNVGGSIANVNTVGGAIANVNTVAGEINNNKLQTVANNINAVVTAANDLNEATSEIDTVANAITNVDNVGNNIANVNTVAGIASNVTSVAGNATNINTVAGAITNVNNVGGSIANVNTCATNLSGINSFAERYRTDNTGNNPSSNNDAGDLFFNQASGKLLVYNGLTSAWEETQSVGNFFINTISSFSGTGGNSATFNGSAYKFTLSNAGQFAQQMLVSINGVVQKPNTGTGQPSEGFALDGANIVFSSPPPSGADFFIVTIGASVSIGTPSDNTVTSAKIVDGSIVNADVNANAAIAGTKISPDFGSQNIATTGNLTIGDSIIHSGDTDTKIRFSGDNQISLDAGGYEKIRLNNTTYIQLYDHIVPNNDSTKDIGLTGTRFRAAYVDTYYGDGSNLTGLLSVANQADNRILTATGTTDALNAESGLTYDGNNFNVSAGAHDSGMAITAANNSQETQLSIIGKHADGTSHTFKFNAKRSANRLDIEGGNSPRISVDANGYVGINQSAPQSELQVGGGTNSATNKPTVHIAPSSGDAKLALRGGSPTIAFDITSGGNPKILTDGADLAISSGTLDSNGTFRHYLTQHGYIAAKGQAGSWIADPTDTNTLYHQFINTGNGKWAMQIKQEHHNGMNTQMLVNSVTNIEAFQIYSTSNNTTRFRVLNNGNCANANNSFGSLSDVKLKENIVDANSQWDDVKAVKVRNFNFKDDKDTKLLGVVAQEVETVSSGLVFETIDRDPDDSTKEIGTTKNVKYSILYMKAFKALQEAMVRIETLETKVATLEGS